jgi:hypothetical protein
MDQRFPGGPARTHCLHPKQRKEMDARQLGNAFGLSTHLLGNRWAECVLPCKPGMIRFSTLATTAADFSSS